MAIGLINLIFIHAYFLVHGIAARESIKFILTIISEALVIFSQHSKA
jgi:hypothetical protein